MSQKIRSRGEKERSLARSTPNRCLKGFIVVTAPNAAAGAPCHASVLVTGCRVRSRGCRPLVSVVRNRIKTVIVLREAKA